MCMDGLNFSIQDLRERILLCCIRTVEGKITVSLPAANKPATWTAWIQGFFSIQTIVNN